MRPIKILSALFAACVLLTTGSCKREENGVATFYFDQNGPNATVQVDGQTGNITANYQTGPPVCGITATGCANFNLPVGTYNYTGSSSTSSWNGAVTIEDNGCAEVNLQQTTGSITFWTANSVYGNITVTIGGGNGSSIINTAFMAQPLCGAQGCATFNLPPGTYSYTASAANGGATWGPAAFTVTADGCQTIQFTP